MASIPTTWNTHCPSESLRRVSPSGSVHRLRQAFTEYYCTKLKCVCKRLIINKLLVEAAGVELIRVLITRKLLSLGTATRAKKAPLHDPLYVYCTKCFRSDGQQMPYSDPSIPQVRPDRARKARTSFRKYRFALFSQPVIIEKSWIGSRVS